MTKIFLFFCLKTLWFDGRGGVTWNYYDSPFNKYLVTASYLRFIHIFKNVFHWIYYFTTLITQQSTLLLSATFRQALTTEENNTWSARVNPRGAQCTVSLTVVQIYGELNYATFYLQSCQHITRSKDERGKERNRLYWNCTALGGSIYDEILSIKN